MSKFDYESFIGGYDNLAVSKEKYTREQAIEIAKTELESINKPYYIAVCDGYARHRAGRNEDGECCVGWWLEYREHTRSCPCWVFHKAKDQEYDSKIFKDYEYIHVPATVKIVQQNGKRGKRGNELADKTAQKEPDTHFC